MKKGIGLLVACCLLLSQLCVAAEGLSVETAVRHRDGTITVSGNLGMPVEAEVTILVLPEGRTWEDISPETADAVSYLGMVRTDATGAFTQVVELPLDAPSGTYTIKVSRSGAASLADTQSVTAYYSDEVRTGAALTKMNEATADTISAIMADYKAKNNVLGLAFSDLYEANREAIDRAFVYLRDEMPDGKFADLDSILATEEKATALGRLNAIQTAEELGAELATHLTVLGIELDEALLGEAMYPVFLAQKKEAEPAGVAALTEMLTDAGVTALINQASREQMDEILTKYQAAIGLTLPADYDGFTPYEVAMGLTGKDFANLAAVKDAFDARIAALNEPDDGPGGGGGSPSGGSSSGGSRPTGGGGSITGGMTITGEEPTSQPDAPVFSFIFGVAWAEEAVTILAKKGILQGDGSGNFRPNDLVTREEFLKMLVLAAGLTGEAEVPFADVAADAWYYGPVATAYQHGITTGVTESLFGIGEQVTRQDAATFLYRAAQAAGVTWDTSAAPASFTDADQIASYALPGVQAMQAAGILSGMGDGTFAPQAHATRAETAVMIYRAFMESGTGNSAQ